MKRILELTTLLLCVLPAAAFTNAQSKNLLQNPNGDLESQYWKVHGHARVELAVGDNPWFVVRNRGYFFQDVSLPNNAAGQYAVLIGRGSSERINADGAITGLPNLYGYMMEEADRGGRVLKYLQGQNMLSSANVNDEWVELWGIFRVVEGTKAIRFFLNQAERRGVPQDGSAARFDDLGLYLFSTKEAAEAFVNSYR